MKGHSKFCMGVGIARHLVIQFSFDSESFDAVNRESRFITIHTVYTYIHFFFVTFVNRFLIANVTIAIKLRIFLSPHP